MKSLLLVVLLVVCAVGVLGWSEGDQEQRAAHIWKLIRERTDLIATSDEILQSETATPAHKHHHTKQHHVLQGDRARLTNPLPTSCSGKPNSIPVTTYDESSAQPIASVENGTLSSITAQGMSTPLLVLHLYGDSYSMGYAYGQLLADTLVEMIPQAYQYFEDKYHLPDWLVNELLDLTRNTTRAYTPSWHFDFLQGVSDGTGNTTSFINITRIAMIPEAIKAACSIAGAYDSATYNGGLLQLRALDWGTDGPFQQYPLLTNYHPNDGSFDHSSLGWVGLYGTLTGFSSSKLAVSEKVWYNYKKLQNIIGYPWTFLLQDIMRFDADSDMALSRIGQALRTCAIWIGLGQGAKPSPHAGAPDWENRFTLVQYSFEQLSFWNAETFPEYQGHDYQTDLIWINKHPQPSGEPCMNDLMHWGYGNFSATDFFQYVTAMEQTGDMHIAVMDFQGEMMYISNAAPMPNNTPAYNNGFVQFNMTQIWNQQAPSKKML